ncbi:MAG: DUF5106 domain-containing protein [Bacteroidales bacterium]
MKKSIIILCSIACMLSCNNNKGKTESTFVPLKMIDVPAMITEPEERSKYIVDHFWKMMNFQDTSYLQNIHNLNVHFSAYVDYLVSAAPNAAINSVSKLVDSALNGNPKITSRFREMFEAAFYSPNSIYRNEELYIFILEKYLKSGKYSDAERVQMQYQLDLAYRNRVGTKAIDFKFILEDGSMKSLYGINSAYTILMFFDPDCPTCKSVMEEMKASAILSQMSSSVKVLTMYAGVDYERWMKEVKQLNKKWINGCDKEMKLSEGPLYDLRPTPAIYLLDKNKLVLLKDAPFKIIEEYLKKL